MLCYVASHGSGWSVLLQMEIMTSKSGRLEECGGGAGLQHPLMALSCGGESRILSRMFQQLRTEAVATS